MEYRQDRDELLEVDLIILIHVEHAEKSTRLSGETEQERYQKYLITRMTKGFIASSGMDKNSSVEIVPEPSLSSFLNRLYSRQISLWLTAEKRINGKMPDS